METTFNTFANRADSDLAALVRAALSGSTLFAYGNMIRYVISLFYEGGSICNESPFITPSTKALGFYAICQTKDQYVAIIMVHKTLFYLSKFNKLQTF